MQLRVAQHMAEHRATIINDRLAQMAERVERATEGMRRLAASGYTLDQKVTRRSPTWPGCSRTWARTPLTTDLVGWLQMDAGIKRLGGSTEEATES